MLHMNRKCANFWCPSLIFRGGAQSQNVCHRHLYLRRQSAENIFRENHTNLRDAISSFLILITAKPYRNSISCLCIELFLQILSQLRKGQPVTQNSNWRKMRDPSSNTKPRLPLSLGKYTKFYESIKGIWMIDLASNLYQIRCYIQAETAYNPPLGCGGIPHKKKTYN